MAHLSLLTTPPHKQAPALSFTSSVPQTICLKTLKDELGPQKKAGIIRSRWWFYTSLHVFKMGSVVTCLMLCTGWCSCVSVCLEEFNFIRVDLQDTFFKVSRSSLQPFPSPSLVELQEQFLLRTFLTLSALFKVTLDTNNQEYMWKLRKTKN